MSPTPMLLARAIPRAQTEDTQIKLLALFLVKYLTKNTISNENKHYTL